MTPALAFGLAAGTLVVLAPFAAHESLGAPRSVAMLTTSGAFFCWGIVLLVVGRRQQSGR